MSNYDRKKIEQNIRELEELVVELEYLSASYSDTGAKVVASDQIQRFAHSLYIEDEPLVISGESESKYSKS